MKIVEAQGFSKEVALENSKLNVEVISKNATKAYEAAGSPSIGSPAMKAFCNEFYSNVRPKLASGSSCVIILKNGVKDTRTRPYEITDVESPKSTYKMDDEGNFITEDVEVEVIDADGNVTTEIKSTKIVDVAFKTKWQTAYVVVALDDNEEIGKYTTLADAKACMKELISEEKVNAEIRLRKIPTNRDEVVAIGKYTPSKSAVEGKYIFFGVERD